MADDSTIQAGRPGRNADLPTRIASAVVMLAVSGAAFWAGGLVLAVFVWTVAMAAFGEYVLLVRKAAPNALVFAAALLFGAVYFGLAARVLATLDTYYFFAAIGAVICTDIGAFFAGRAIGGPRIAPKISPSKTWAGLFGGMALAALWLAGVAGAFFYTAGYTDLSELIDIAWDDAIGAALVGALLAIVAQAGDFFESWIKRKAGVKDSSHLIPGHGGVFDRVDGIIPVALIIGILSGFS